MNNTKRYFIDSLCIILYLILYNFLNLRLGPIHILFYGAPVILAAILSGPRDGLAVGLLGSFLSEYFGPYGISITTPLWMFPSGVLGLITGWYAKRKDFDLTPPGPFIIVLFLALCADTTINIGATYLDSMFYRYPFSFSISGAIWQYVADIIKTVIYALALLPLQRLLRRKPQ